MNIVELVQNNILDYAGAVNQARAIPDARTGLKPIHRKIIYEMYADKIRSDGKYKKCAYMVGQVIARFSEHGDAATYDALVRLGQQWIQRYPLVDFHGNNGSQFGDGPAAMRYTEAKLTKLSEDGLLSSLGKDTVDWIPNFTNEENEPSTMPAIFPGLFCLPNQGMGYGAACHFVTFKLSDVLHVIEQYINQEELDIIYPDFASGAQMINPEIMENIYKTGKGSVILDSVYTIKNNTIEITQIPFNVDFDDIMDEVVTLVESEEVSGISSVKNNSGAGKLSLIIEVEKGFNPEDIMNILFNKTKLRNSYPVNQIALVNNQPKLLTTVDMIKIYVEHNINCICREYSCELRKIQERIEILEGLLKALVSIDDVVKIIRASKDKAAAKTNLIASYGFTENQVEAILKMQLSRLANMEQIAIEDELEEKKNAAIFCQEIINSQNEQQKILLERLRELVKKYDNARRTLVESKAIVTSSNSKKTKEKIIEDVVVTLTDKGYIKNIPVKGYRAVSGDKYTIKGRTDEMILLFSSLGKVYRIKVDSIKQCGARDKGTAIGAIVTLGANESILYMTSMNVDAKHPYLTFVSKSGMIKKSDKTIYFGSTQNKNGLKCAGLKDDDYFIFINETNGDYLTMITTDNMALQIELDKINITGKMSKGVIGIKFNDGQSLKEAKSSSIENKKIPVRNRGGKGVPIG